MDKLPKFPKMPDELIELEAEEFLFAVELASAAMARQYPIDDPGKNPIHIQFSDPEEVLEVRLTDIPENRMGLELIKHFAHDHVKASSCLFRIMALQNLISKECNNRLAPWIKDDPSEPDYMSIRDGVVALAGRFPVNIKMQFDADAFIEELKATVPTQEIGVQDEGQPDA